ncbi:phosphate/phosphite/phosphonate ABC transporter substrate-binding protein [Falsiroseomonas oryziterrae]|uniref:phosphate/phosphite/phosphonate ABC transporter substrate-binding protein n=1 Tax=Falsiroseomonas oryziterrae TaxID=2911368 RepID=UPI001F01826D|nr:phosphate/phosphite/phosphonate ABC transporter substrate-binding protein [Roseomonas sp. NPKOSM-4]
MPILRRSLLAAGALAPAAAPALGQNFQPFPERGRRRWAREMPIIRVGLPSVEADGGALARYDGYARLLETTYGVPVSTFQPASEAEMVQAFAGGMIDFAFMSAMGYAATWQETSGGVEPVLVTLGPDGSSGIISVVIVRSDYWILDFEMLQRRSFAWVARESMEGHLLPRMEMRAQGVDPDRFFGRTVFAGGHEQAILAVITRQVDGAVTWASGTGEEREGFSRSTMRDMAAANMIRLDDLRFVWRSGLIPNAPLVMRRNVATGFRDDMLSFHFALPSGRPDILRSLGRPLGWGPTAHSFYERFVQLRIDQAEQSRRAEEQRRREEEVRLAAEEQKRREEAVKRRRELAEERRRRFEAQFR